MKKKNIKIIAIAIMSLVILAGIVVVGIFGFNKELRYGQGQVINVYVEQMVDATNIKKLVNECLAGKTNMVQTVEIYQDYVTIKAKEITEEQKNNIVNKLKENYEFLLSIIAITRIPVGRYTPVLVIAMYIASIMMVIRENEK